ncbi:nitroreductase/quinone reductase family protein [Streptomyces sp. RS10V-4]|uniref:nitroreductase/quinone reductase family protein n=1 Tax=Streptomyces rhizoryzae TaxID=2932493 RepID=UPI00200492AE|nr:nitroreductase/quinone reductase family protein [Streptomyces rhizoryzae]MCK7622671.1 nitroreductase/quinone reductase family protein [Streptomyces rhizoryzae]
MPLDFNQQVIDEFRANRGRVGGPFEGGRLVLLTTTGARTGARHTTPVGYLPDGARILVIASAGGSPRHPDWFRNLVAHPRVTVETGVFTYEAEATVLSGAERDEVFARAVEADPGWAAYQAKTRRTIPVVALAPAEAGPPRFAGATPGESVGLVHDAFRRELALIRKELAATGSVLGAQLRINCLTLCQGLDNHHTGEDRMMFPALRRHRPDLAPVLDRLDEEHRSIAALLEALRQVLAAPAAEPGAVRAEVERLAGELEAHLDYEEQELIPALDAAAG